MHNDQWLANTFEICDTIPSLNLNLFSGQPHSDIVQSIPLELALHVPIVPTVSDEEYPNCAKSFPQFIFFAQRRLSVNHRNCCQRGFDHFPKWKHDNGPIISFVTESVPERALSSEQEAILRRNTSKRALLTRIKSLTQGVLIMIEPRLFLLESFQDCGSCGQLWAMVGYLKFSISEDWIYFQP